MSYCNAGLSVGNAKCSRWCVPCSVGIFKCCLRRGPYKFRTSWRKGHFSAFYLLTAALHCWKKFGVFSQMGNRFHSSWVCPHLHQQCRHVRWTCHFLVVPWEIARAIFCHNEGQSLFVCALCGPRVEKGSLKAANGIILVCVPKLPQYIIHDPTKKLQ